MRDTHAHLTWRLNFGIARGPALLDSLSGHLFICLCKTIKQFFQEVCPQVAQAPLGTVNMTLHNSVIIRSYKIVQNKGENKTKSFTCPVVCITCVLMAFGGVSE